MVVVRPGTTCRPRPGNQARTLRTARGLWRAPRPGPQGGDVLADVGVERAQGLGERHVQPVLRPVGGEQLRRQLGIVADRLVDRQRRRGQRAQGIGPGGRVGVRVDGGGVRRVGEDPVARAQLVEPPQPHRHGPAVLDGEPQVPGQDHGVLRGPVERGGELAAAIGRRDQQAGSEPAVAGDVGSAAQRVPEAASALGHLDEQRVELPVPLGGGRPARVPAVPRQRRRGGRVAGRAVHPDRCDRSGPAHPQDRRARGPLRHAEIAQHADQDGPRQRRRGRDLGGAEHEEHETGGSRSLCDIAHDRIR